MKGLKLSFYESVTIRNLRKSNTVNQLTNEFKISRALIHKVCQYTDYELLCLYSSYDNPLFNKVKIVNATENTVTLYYIEGIFKGLQTTISNYYLFEANFVESFNTLTDTSKKILLEYALEKDGYTNAVVQRVGDDIGIDNRYTAIANGKRFQWKELMGLKTMQTILNIKGEKNGKH